MSTAHLAIGDYVRIVFPLTPDAAGFPPAESERLWAEYVGEGLFRIDNTPFFIRGVSHNDIVVAEEEDDGNWHFRKIARFGPNSTVWVVAFTMEAVPRLRDDLRALGCASELSHIASYFAIDIPPAVDIKVVRAYLQKAQGDGLVDFCEAALTGLVE